MNQHEQLKDALMLGQGKDEVAAIWYTKDDADWCTGQCLVSPPDDDFEFTDEEWAEIAGRFNNMDWQYISEVFDDLCHDVLAERKSCEE